MQLIFFLGNDFIDAVRLDPEKISIPGYLGNLKRSLQVRYRETILQHVYPPEFLVMPAAAANNSTASNSAAHSYAAA